MIWNKSSWLVSGIVILSLVQLTACSKLSTTVPPHCKDESIQNSLLELTTPTINHAPLNLGIINITTLKNFPDGAINCQAIIDYTHKIIPTEKYRLAYNFTLNHDGQITAVTPQNVLKYNKYKTWLTQLPQLVGQQNSRGGSLNILQTLDKNKQVQQQLYLNANSIALQGQKNVNKITITQAINLANQDVFIFNINNAKLNNNANYLLAIHSESQLYISPKFTYQNINIDQSKSQINFLGARKYQFSESTDYPIYQFQNNRLKLIQTNRPLNYYQHKFATLTATQILVQIKADGCLNGDQFYSSDICANNISTYCFKFNSIDKPQKSKPYWLLQEMCLNHYEYSN